jgi:hypothetical protein
MAAGLRTCASASSCAAPKTNWEEVVARMSYLTMARASYDLAVAQWPLKLIMLCQGGRILRRSDRPKE